ncbi:MAG: hypothetical protein GX197_01960 [Firmicutes bacterium]|nr:hypothetical protein [Bacillota bacterium]
MEKIALADIYDPNGILLVAKGAKITEEKLLRLQKFGLKKENLKATIAPKETLTQLFHGEKLTLTIP